MAGGIGSRFWPMSTEERPKQFLDILGTGKTLIQQTYSRLLKIAPKENILIVTSTVYKGLVLEQLPDLTEQQVLCEPTRKNTAPCIAYANYKIAEINPNANVVVAPADHLILDESSFVDTINTAIKQSEREQCLVTLGIKPSRPDTGYGYIQFDPLTAAFDDRIKAVKTFTEKPNLELAQQFIESGDFYWNSGIFIWNLKAIQKEFKNHLPEITELFDEGKGIYNTPEEQSFIDRIYQMCPSVSIDYGIMEKAKNVSTVLSDFGWSDLGTWGSLYTHIPHDKESNAIVGRDVHLYDSKDCVVNVPDDKLVVLQGLDNYIVVEANDVLLVCKKQDEQSIKKYVADIKAKRKL
jgi:mannose-1-phosphate guanylyltransferase